MLSTEVPGKGLRVVASCPRAKQQGIRPGLPLAEAKALAPVETTRRPTTRKSSATRLPASNTVNWQLAEPEADRKAFEQLAQVCQQYTPLVAIEAIDHPDSLFLDVSGCKELWGGEASLLEKITQQFRGMGYLIRAALASTQAAAWAISHFGEGEQSLVPDDSNPQFMREVLGDLPIAALGLPEGITQRLGSFGIRNISQLCRLPRTAIPSRFGPQVLRRLDQALGSAPEAFTALRWSTPITVFSQQEEPLVSREAILWQTRLLLEDLLGQLAARRAGLVEFEYRLSSLTGPLAFLLRLSAPATNLRHLHQLLELRLEQQSSLPEVTKLEIVALRVGPLPEWQPSFWQTSETQTALEVAQLADRLSSRLGESSVSQVHLEADCLPEQSYTWHPWTADLPETDWLHEASPAAEQVLWRARYRPWRLWSPMLPVTVLRCSADGLPTWIETQEERHEIASLLGPERIETAWWQAREVRRNYYRMTTTTGFCFWSYYDLDQQQWFLQGEF